MKQWNAFTVIKWLQQSHPKPVRQEAAGIQEAAGVLDEEHCDEERDPVRPEAAGIQDGLHPDEEERDPVRQDILRFILTFVCSGLCNVYNYIWSLQTF